MTLRYLAIIWILISLAACQTASVNTPVATNTVVNAVTSNPMPTVTRNTASPTRTIVPLQPCVGAVSPKLILYERARVSFNGDRLRLRRGPSTSYEAIVNLQPGDTFLVVDGPSCAEGYSWYRIAFGDLTGWVAEGDVEEYFAEPFPPG